MIVRMNQFESMAVACLAQYTKLPSKMKNQLISLMSKEYRPIGQMLAGKEPDYSTPELEQAVKQLQKWAYTNKHNSSVNRRKNNSKNS